MSHPVCRVEFLRHRIGRLQGEHRIHPCILVHQEPQRQHRGQRRGRHRIQGGRRECRQPDQRRDSHLPKFLLQYCRTRSQHEQRELRCSDQRSGTRWGRSGCRYNATSDCHQHPERSSTQHRDDHHHHSRHT